MTNVSAEATSIFIQAASSKGGGFWLAYPKLIVSWHPDLKKKITFGGLPALEIPSSGLFGQITVEQRESRDGRDKDKGERVKEKQNRGEDSKRVTLRAAGPNSPSHATREKE